MLSASLATVQGAETGVVVDVPDNVGRPTFSSPHANPIVVHGDFVYAVNTPADTVDVIDAGTNAVVNRINVGVDPVGLAVKPDGTELWVTNHISDSVSVIDTDADSDFFQQVVGTVNDFHPNTLATRFDEPVGVAFADDSKAYVALSTSNRIAIVDVATRKVTGRLTIAAQDPRAIAVRNNRLYVIAFESNNQTQLSGCEAESIDDDVCTFDAVEHVFRNNNVLSTNYDADIVKNTELPDRDLFIFDTDTDRRLRVVSGVGTLLYGLAVDSSGTVYVAQAEARNDANGRAGTQGEGLAEMENRAFLNQITQVDCPNACSETRVPRPRTVAAHAPGRRDGARHAVRHPSERRRRDAGGDGCRVGQALHLRCRVRRRPRPGRRRRGAARRRAGLGLRRRTGLCLGSERGRQHRLPGGLDDSIEPKRHGDGHTRRSNARHGESRTYRVQRCRRIDHGDVLLRKLPS